MPEETLETLAEDLSDITLESSEESITNGNGEIIENDPVTESTEEYDHFQNLEDLLDFLNEYSQEKEEAPSMVLAAPPSHDSITFDSDSPVYHIEFNGSFFDVLFSKEDDQNLLLSEDGLLINLGSSNITGVVLDEMELDLNTYHQKFLTLYPVTSTSAQNNLYRYGAAAYMTTYSPGTGNNLSTSVTYDNPVVLDQPNKFHNWNSFNLILIGLIMVLIFVQFIGGLIRR